MTEKIETGRENVGSDDNPTDSEHSGSKQEPVFAGPSRNLGQCSSSRVHSMVSTDIDQGYFYVFTHTLSYCLSLLLESLGTYMMG